MLSEKWENVSDLEYILKVEPTECATGLETRIQLGKQ